ncbi:MAG TPA: glycerophosphodiester phosphodiesterase [Acidimicrobiales bacterium]|nr:glycerophosphodiester phosphodiesterase [Acidimicrobiales bacterium]
MTTRWAFLDHPGPIPFAHRGGAGEWPENTMAAFEHAVGLGYRYLETDVHLTADGVLVAFHDDVLDRLTDRRGRIAALPWSEVRQARVDGQPIPLLEELLGAWPDVRVNIDPKHDASVRPLVEALDRTGAHDRVCVSAFSDRRLARFRQLTAGRVCTGTGPVEVARLRAAGYWVPCGRFAADCAQVPLRWQGVKVVDRRFLAAAHRRSLPVHVWTVDDPDQMEQLLDMGIDGIMTDRPVVLKEVLQRRGQWVG